MKKKEILERLYLVKENYPLNAEDKDAINEAIRLVKKKNWKENLFKILELLAKLVDAGSKFFNP